jgi:hypothetical protein
MKSRPQLFPPAAISPIGINFINSENIFGLNHLLSYLSNPKVLEMHGIVKFQRAPYKFKKELTPYVLAL